MLLLVFVLVLVLVLTERKQIFLIRNPAFEEATATRQDERHDSDKALHQGAHDQIYTYLGGALRIFHTQRCKKLRR